MAFTAAQEAEIDARILVGMDQMSIHSKIDERVRLGMPEMEAKMGIGQIRAEITSLTQAAAVA